MPLFSRSGWDAPLSDYRAGGPPRHRGRKALLVGLPIVLVIAAGGATAAVLKKRHDDAVARSRAEATAVVQGWLTAVAKGDTAAAASYATPDSAAAVRSVLPAARAQLDPVSASYTMRGPVSIGSDPGAAFTAKLDVAGFGDYGYTGTVPLLKSGGHWKVAFTPEVFHPQLHAGGTFVRTRTVSTRGKVLLAGGESMATADADLSANLRGSVGTVATAAEAKKLGPLVNKGDDTGISGLERVYDSTLRGAPGGTLGLKDPSGHVTNLLTVPATPGKDVTTTLDLKTQQAGEQAVRDVGYSGALVAMDTQTGHVLAMVDHPPTGTAISYGINSAPGSTFKIVTATAGLLAGHGPSTTYPCSSTVTEDGRTLANSEHESFGTIDFAEAFAVSCNTWFVQLGVHTPYSTLEKAAALYGFSVGTQPSTGILPITSLGGNYPVPRDDAAVAGESIGQDGVSATTVQMASVAAAVASGTWRQPIVTADSPQKTNVIPGTIAATLRGFMAGVVKGNGTAAGVSFPAGTIGKTGTAETTYSATHKDATDSWFVAINGNVAVAAVFYQAGFGADVAAPAVARFLRLIGR